MDCYELHLKALHELWARLWITARETCDFFSRCLIITRSATDLNLFCKKKKLWNMYFQSSDWLSSQWASVVMLCATNMVDKNCHASSLQNKMNKTCWHFVVVYDQTIIPLAAPEQTDTWRQLTATCLARHQQWTNSLHRWLVFLWYGATHSVSPQANPTITLHADGLWARHAILLPLVGEEECVTSRKTVSVGG